MNKVSVLIVGGGASGMFCAIRLARFGISDVAIVERNDRLGRKLSATGNGQGNVTNENMSAAHYFSSTGSAAGVLQKFGKEQLLRALGDLGGLFGADKTGRVYPASRQASSVTDILRFALAEEGINVLTKTRVTDIVSKKDGFTVKTEQGDLLAECVVLACGGKASPHFGTDGSGYELAKKFGHTCTPLFPSLVQLKTEQTYIRGLKGIRSDCKISLHRFGKGEIFSRRGDVLFTDYGVSGDAIFSASAFARAGDELKIDFLPSFMRDIVLRILAEKMRKYPKMRAEDLLRCVVNSAVGRNILKYCSIPLDAPASEISPKLPQLVDALKGFSLKITGSAGFENAQVTKGGIPMTELDESLMSKKKAGLFLTGELVDIDGECGGYNLQWAFSSGAVAAEGIAKRLGYEI